VPRGEANRKLFPSSGKCSNAPAPSTPKSSASKRTSSGRSCSKANRRSQRKGPWADRNQEIPEADGNNREAIPVLVGGGKPLSTTSFVTAAALALCGIAISIYGIANEHFKPTAIGLVLIFGSGVFATLCLASRQRS